MSKHLRRPSRNRLVDGVTSLSATSTLPAQKTPTKKLLWTAITLIAMMGRYAVAEDAAKRLPITELTVFKDGHAFVTREGALQTDAAGEAVLDELPAPILGTFWPYSLEADLALTGATAGRRTVQKEASALGLRELLRVNVGAKVRITDADKQTFEATVGELLENVPAAGAGDPTSSAILPVTASGFVLLGVEGGVRAFPVDRIRDVTFAEGPKTKVGREESANRLILQFATGEPKSVRAGLLYLQKGLRWIPSYKIDLDGSGHAAVRLEATLINELGDFEDAKVHLVVGVPHFAFAGTMDPMALGQMIQFLQEDTNLSNAALTTAIMTQVAGPASPSVGPGPDLGPAIGKTGDREDLFVFTLDRLSMRKGDRKVVPVAEYSLAYQDLYRVIIPPSPPTELREHFDSSQAARTAQLTAAPKVVHAVRLSNAKQHPLTTAPALILSQGVVLAQSMMTYTPRNAQVDLDIGETVNIQVQTTDYETERTPNAETWNREQYQKVTMSGEIALANFEDKPVKVEVLRYAWGEIDEAPNGDVKQVNVFESRSADLGMGWDSVRVLPEWWWHFNGIGKITWLVDVQPGVRAAVSYRRHYFSK